MIDAKETVAFKSALNKFMQKAWTTHIDNAPFYAPHFVISRNKIEQILVELIDDVRAAA